jgi:hypothetical protein
METEFRIRRDGVVGGEEGVGCKDVAVANAELGCDGRAGRSRGRGGMSRLTRRQSLVMGAVELEPNWADSRCCWVAAGEETWKQTKLLERSVRAMEMKGKEECLRWICLHCTGRRGTERVAWFERVTLRVSKVRNVQSSEAGRASTLPELLTELRRGMQSARGVSVLRVRMKTTKNYVSYRFR